MIYKAVSLKDDLRQGDIFYNLPFVMFNLDHLIVSLDQKKFEKLLWIDIEKDKIEALTSLKKSNAIILSQDCDCLRSPLISMIVISPWNKKPKTDYNWMKEILHLNKHSPSKMYLPPDKNFNILNRMHIDFSIIFNLSRKNLESLKKLRICRLNEEAMEHFREKMAYYFHRYAYSEYYPMNSKEMDEYEKDRENKFERREYQKL